MAFVVVLTESAAREVRKLDKSVRERIISKLQHYAMHENLSAAKRLGDESLGTWRYRIGDWRVVFDMNGKELQILKVAHRSEVYE